MRIRRQPPTQLKLAAEILQFLAGDPAFQIRAGIHPRRGMTLKINNIPIAALSLCTQKMIKSYLVKRGRRSVSRNMPADPLLNLVSAHYHSQRVPANQAFNAAFHLLTARKRRLLAGRNRVLVGSCGSKRKVDSSLAPGVQRKLLQQAACTIRATFGEHIIERIDPLSCFEDL